MPGDNPRRKLFPTRWHLLCFAIMAFLASTGHVTLQTTATILLSTLYLLLLSAYSFPPSSQPRPPALPAAWTRILPRYATFTGVIGLILPSLYILHGAYVAGDSRGVGAAAPHVFLLASQVAMEGVMFAAGYSGPVWAFIPVFYNSWRMAAVLAWARAEFTSLEGSRGPALAVAGRGIALANLLLWSFNLFGFLLPVFLPSVFKSYYAANNAANKVE